MDKEIKEAFDEFNKQVNNLPDEYKCPPANDKFCEGSPVLDHWVENYLMYRQNIENDSDKRHKAKKYLSLIGQNSSNLASKYRGTLLGMAIGDALGTTLEFKSRDTYQPISDIVGGGPFDLEAGQWTDDTSMALCLTYSLLNKKGFDANNQMELYKLWRDKGAFSVNGKCFDIGQTVSSSINK